MLVCEVVGLCRSPRPTVHKKLANLDADTMFQQEITSVAWPGTLEETDLP